MNKFLQMLSINIEDSFASKIKNSMQKFISEHPQISCLSLLALACFIFLFWGLNFYPLLDVDETRYAIMSRDLMNSFDFNSLMLNYQPFLEKPPLYFWIVGLSIKLFGGLSGFAARFPIALLATFIVFFTYFFGEKIISRKFGLISAFVLLSSVFFLIFAHIAILDMVLTVFITSAIYCGFLTHFCEEKYKKYNWWYFYLFVGLGFLSKGILALVIPFTIIFIYNLITKTAKDIFKPVNLIPGIIILALVGLPWHLIMYQEYGFQFIKEYFLLHHFGRFMGAEALGRERPLLYFVPIFLLGFMPWTFAFLAFVFDGFKKLGAKFKNTEGKIKEKFAALFEITTNEQKLILFASIYFVVIFALFSIASTKLPTYILPVFPAAALLTGYYWWVSDEKNENEKSIYNTTVLFCSLFIFAAVIASLAYFFFPYDLQSQLKRFWSSSINAIYLLCIFLILRLRTKRVLSIFSGYVFFMVFVIALSVSQLFNLVYAGGEDEIVSYSAMSTDPLNTSQLVTFDFSVKPSAMINYQDKIQFITDADFDKLDELLKYKGGPTFVIVKNKNLRDNLEYQKEIEKRLEKIQEGQKYSLYVKDVRNEYDDASQEDYENDPFGINRRHGSMP